MDFQYINLALLTELSRGNRQFQVEMLQLFKVQSDECMAELNQYLKENNRVQIAATAHKLKSSFGLVGADVTSLAELEKIKEGDYESEKIVTEIHNLGLQLDEIKKEIDNELK